LCFPSSAKRWYVVIFACWVFFATASIFSSVAHEWLMWVPPSTLLIVLMGDRYRSNVWPRPILMACPVFLALCFFLFIQIYPFLSPRPMELKMKDAQVHLGSEMPSAFVLYPVPTIMGERYGQLLRDFLSRNPGSGVAVEWEADTSIPANAEVIVLAGELEPDRFGELFSNTGKSIIWLNPVVSDAQFSSLKQLPWRGRIVWGSLRARSDLSRWRELAQESGDLQLKAVPFSAEFLSFWPEELGGSGLESLSRKPQ
jgi:hypothetical protein